MSFQEKVCLLVFGLLAWANPTIAQSAPQCLPPPGFVDTSHPTLAPPAQLVSHTEEITINRPLDVVLDVEGKTSLENTIDKKTPLPSVSGTYMLTKGSYVEPGSRRLTCLTDGSTLVEEVLENSRDKKSAQFRYVVWKYTSEKARPIQYGIGHFIRTDLGDGHTHVRWTYSFQLKRDRFPGSFGAFGDWLFRIGFLDRQYAEMMRGSLLGSKVRIESIPLAANK